MSKSNHQTRFIRFTGLSGSGKCTNAHALKTRLESKEQAVIIIDGDVVREKFHQHLSFSPNDIKKNNRLIVKYCLSLRGKYDYVLITVIAPFAISRQFAREKLEPNYKEVYIKASLDTVTQRDVKGLYDKAKRGEISHMVGVDPATPYEVPTRPDLVINTEQLSVAQSSDLCLQKLAIDSI